MAKQVIQLGTSVNDGTGDPLRTAFSKINDNFTELYATQIPSQTSNSGKYLTTNGTTLSWGTVSAGADLGNFKISSDTLGTKAQSGNGWGGYWMYLDPAGEGSSGIAIPSTEAQNNGNSLQIYHTDIDSGPLQLTTNSGTWSFQQDGKLSGPLEGTLEIDSNLIMNIDKGFVVEVGRFPMAIDGNDWWFDVVINKDGYVYCFGGADIEYNENGAPLIVKFDSHGNVVWKKYYSYPEGFNNPLIVSADFKTSSVISVLAEVWVYDSGTDSNFDQLVYFEINTSDGSVVTDSGYTLRASDSTENLNASIWAKQIRYNSDKSKYAIVGSKFGDSTDYTITTPSAISTTPGVLKVLKSTLDTTLGITNIWTYNNAYTIRGYGFTSTVYFTDVTTETIDGQVYYVLSTPSSVDFTTLPNGQSWIIRYYDTETGYIESNSWNKLVDFGGQINWFTSVGFDSSNNIYAAGSSINANSQSGDEASLLVSLTSTGTVRWAKRIDDDNGPGNNEIQGLAVSSDNYVYTVAKDNNGQTAIAKVNSTTGAVSWIKTMTIDGGMSGQYDARIIYCAADNSVVFALEFGSISSVNSDFLLVKLDASGALVWALSFGSSSSENVNWDSGQDFLSADDNFIYVSGSRYTGSDDNAIVFAIPQSGDVSDWVGMYKVLDFSENITFDTGSTLSTDVAITTTTSTNVVDSSFATEASDAGYEVRRAYLNGGQNKLMNVAKIEFADGTTQRTSATDIPLTQIMTGEETTYLNEGHRGGFIMSRYGGDTINVPTHIQNPLPIGMVVTIILDQPNSNNKVYITGESDGGDGGAVVVIRPVGSSTYNNRYWSVGGDNVQGLYTLMKIDKNVWMLSGATINNED